MTTPMMQQYREAKERHPGMLVFFRNGDFYELFEEDAEVGSRLLGITLTKRDHKTPMAGVPHHALERYLGKLMQAGHRVAICDQMEEAAQAKGIIRREVTRVVTPGTLTEDDLLDPRRSNHLVALFPEAGRANRIGLAWVELSTGQFLAADVAGPRLEDELSRLRPAECLVADNDTTGLAQRLRAAQPESTLTPRFDWTFDPASARAVLHHHFGITTLAGFGFDDDQPCVVAAGSLLLYLRETLKASLGHLTRLRPYRQERFLFLDEVTRRSLELTRGMREGGRDGSLLSVLDRTVTPMGTRLLQDWLTSPLAERGPIEGRLDAVGELVEDSDLRQDIRHLLHEVSDLQRLTARVSTGRASPRDLGAVARTLRQLPKFKAKVAARKTPLLRELDGRLELCPDLREALEGALVDDPPQNARDAGIIRRGYDAELDELHGLAHEGKDWMARFQAAEITRTGITSLKVGYNQNHGYFIEVTNTHAAKVPPEYRRRATLKNAERYVTPELTDYGDKVIGAQDKIGQREYDLFVALRERVAAQTQRLLAAGEVLSTLDVLAALAELAVSRQYCRPQIVDAAELHVADGRHPVLDQILPPGTFVPNDVSVGPEGGNLWLITGPNMAGKCIKGDSLLFTEQGVLPLESLKPAEAPVDQFVPLSCTVHGIAGAVRATHFFNGGISPTIRIQTRLRFALEGTPAHRIWVRHADGSEGWKSLRDVQEGDWVALERQIDLWGSAVRLRNEVRRGHGNEIRYLLPDTLNVDLAYLFGLLLGDGTLTQRRSVHLTTKDPQIADAFRRITWEQFGYRAGVTDGGVDNFITSTQIRAYLAENDLGFHDALHKHIPVCIRRAPRELVISFLQGLFDTDGTAERRYGNPSLSTSSERMAREVQLVLLNLGIIASIRLKRTKVHLNYIVAIDGEDAIRFHRLVGFRLLRKQERRELASSLRRPNKGGIPHRAPLLKEAQTRIVLKKDKQVALKRVKLVNSIFYVYIPKGRNLSYAKLGELLDYCHTNNVECCALEAIHSRRYFYDQVKSVAQGEAQVYDLSVPEGNAYVANGFVSHNSVFIRQAALLALMAQMGSYVPAREAKIGLVDRIFTRVGASDELSRAQSTFMVEMTEAANILNNATPRSLVILDEIGRGTSTYDGVSLAWAITEYLHDHVRCRALCATHYHEMAELAEKLPNLRNYNVLVHEGPDGIVFLHKIAPGSADKSYGIHVAQIAGIPQEVLARARQVLAELEARHVAVPEQPAAKGPRKPRLVEPSLFAHTEDPVLQAMRQADLSKMTAEEALVHLRRWQRELRSGF